MKIARRQLKVEVPTVAMGDIAFNLLVFFVILANAQDDSHLTWTPAKSPKLEGAQRAKVSITVAFDQAAQKHKVYLNGREISTSQVEQGVRDTLGDAPAGERTVLLKIDKNAQANLFEPIIEGASQAGGELMHVLQEDQPGS